MFVQGPRSFYGLRFLLGFAEAGFFPGILLYLSHWIPHAYRARAAAAFLTSTAISGVVGNPVGGLIQYVTDGAPWGLQSWQWLFLLEGIPSVLVGIVTFFYLTDHPRDARWLAAEERLRLAALMAREREAHPAHDAADFKHALTSPHTWVLSALYGMTIFGFYMVNFFTTTIIERSLRASGTLAAATPKHVVDLYVCLFAAIPFGAAAAGMVLIGRHSDKTNERKKHLAFACGLIAAGMTLSAFAPRLAGGGSETLLTIVGLSIAAIGAFGMFGPFWALPPQLLTGTAAAAAFAIINSLGNLFGGFLGPMLRTPLGQQNVLLLAAGLGLLAALLAWWAPIPEPEAGTAGELAVALVPSVPLEQKVQ
jgi:ACS family tartrate transporter-like MFS transporter